MRLSPPPDAGTVDLTGVDVVWTGKEMLAFGWNAVAYRPTTDAWRDLPRTLPGGIVVWTGREAIGWGGGCCGDAWSNGTAYTPVTDAYRNLARSPLAASQHPLGAWTGRELDLFVGGFDPNDKAYPARLARAAAYNPRTNTWRRIAPLPGSDVRYAFRGTAVWDGREILVVGAGVKARDAFAYNPRTNAWRRLAPLPAPRAGWTAVWTGKRLVVWGGSNPLGTAQLADGVAYAPKTDSWSTIPRAPLRARYGPAVQWTGKELIVWGGGIPRKTGAPRLPRDGAAFTSSALR
jgi:N-acetylneuraminic acid mutarotase